MKPFSRSAAALAAILLATMCAGCETSTGNPKLNVSLPDNCQRNAQTVSAPAMKEGDDALALLARTRAALGIANKRINAVKNCDESVRNRFATGR